MKLLCNHSGQILQAQLDSVELYSSRSGERITAPCDVHEALFREGEIEYDRPYVRIEDGCLKFIAVPKAPHHEIYFLRDVNDHWVFGDNFFEIAAHRVEHEEDLEVVTHFLQKGTFPSGRTQLINVRRLLPGSIYRIGRELYRESTVVAKNAAVAPTYEEFKKRLESAVSRHSAGRRCGVMLSGGIDSTAVAIACARSGQRVQSFSMRYLPRQRGVEEDYFGASQSSAHHGWQHHAVEVDFGQLTIEVLRKYVVWTPMGANLSLGFDLLLGKMREVDIEVGFCGQNLDNLYNLGATSRLAINRAGLSDAFRRFFLTEEYAKAVQNAASGRMQIINWPWRLAGYAGAGLYSAAKRNLYVAPRSVGEIVRNFAESSDGVVFGRDRAEVGADRSGIGAEYAHRAMVVRKIEEYMMASDSQITRRAGDSWGVRTVFPYSSELLMPIWINKRMVLRDVFRPKSFVNQYVREFYPKYYRRPSLGKGDHGMAPHVWATHLLKSELGRALLDRSRMNVEEVVTPMQKLQRCLCGFWLQEIRYLHAVAGIRLMSRS